MNAGGETGKRMKEGDWGKVAEQIACDDLIMKGYVIMERNWRPPHTHLEIDIISRKDDFIIFVEVKARSGMHEDPADALDDRKISRLVRAAERYLDMQPYDYRYRFDLITLTGNENDYHLEHIEDAFLPPLS